METKPKNTGRFVKGNAGKPKGALQKNTKQLKDMILQALDKSGGVDYLHERAKDPKTAAAFLSLIGKVLPMTIAGDGDNPIAITTIERVIVRSKHSNA
jgi:hypothetical protein